VRAARSWGLGASCPVPPVRTVRGGLVRVARTYATEAPGRACQLGAPQKPAPGARWVCSALTSGAQRACVCDCCAGVCKERLSGGHSSAWKLMQLSLPPRGLPALLSALSCSAELRPTGSSAEPRAGSCCSARSGAAGTAVGASALRTAAAGGGAVTSGERALGFGVAATEAIGLSVCREPPAAPGAGWLCRTLGRSFASVSRTIMMHRRHVGDGALRDAGLLRGAWPSLDGGAWPSSGSGLTTAR